MRTFISLQQLEPGLNTQNVFIGRFVDRYEQDFGVYVHNIYGLTEGGTTGIYLSDADHPEALERIADAAMLGKSFAEWSEHILSLIANDAGYRKCCEPFLAATGQPVELAQNRNRLG